MKSQSLVSRPTRNAIVFFLLLAGISMVQARTAKDFFQNSDLTDGNNYSPAGTPTGNNDVRLTTPATVLTLNPGLAVGSVNQTNNLSYTIVTNDPGTADSTLQLGGTGTNTISPNPADVIYLGCPSCSMTFQGPNASQDGIGVLKLIQNSQNPEAQFNVAQPGATLNITADLRIDGLTKVGRGTLNFSNDTITTFGSRTLSVNEGVVNFLPGAVISSSGFYLSVNNPNTAAGTAVTVNLQQSQVIRALYGTIAAPSSGTNTATINLVGVGTNLTISLLGNASYAGTIGGEGSLSVIPDPFQGIFTTQTFAGNNTYSGTTTVGSARTLEISGNTSGQGNYTVQHINGPPGTLSGGGTIGLAANGTITVNGNLAPGPASGIGTLHVNTSGTGGVIFGDGSTFVVRVSSAGSSDLLAITGGSINLTSASDTLSLNALSGAFDGTDYTIATFTQNAGGGTFNTVQGLPSDYTVQYNPTSIKVVAIQQPLQLTGAVSRKMHGTLGPFDVNLLTTEPVECRSSGGNHTLVLTFNNYLVSGSASVTTGTGTVSGTPAFSGKTVIIDLVGVSDMQKLVVTLHNVTDRFSQALPDTPITINMLIGDTTGNKSVNASDISQTKSRSGSATTASNFREDVTVNGTISASDISLVKSRSGAFVP